MMSDESFLEGGKIIEYSPRTIGVRGGFAHVFRVTFEDESGAKACVYLRQWAPGEGPSVGDTLTWTEGDTFVTDFVIDKDGNRLQKFGEAFDLPKDD